MTKHSDAYSLDSFNLYSVQTHLENYYNRLLSCIGQLSFLKNNVYHSPALYLLINTVKKLKHSINNNTNAKIDFRNQFALVKIQLFSLQIKTCYQLRNIRFCKIHVHHSQNLTKYYSEKLERCKLQLSLERQKLQYINFHTMGKCLHLYFVIRRYVHPEKTIKWSSIYTSQKADTSLSNSKIHSPQFLQNT